MNGLVVTEVKMTLLDSKGMKAICNVILNGMISINDIRVVEHRDTTKLMVAMPSRRLRDGSFKDLANPVNSKARSLIEEAVLNEYNKMTTLNDVLVLIEGK